MKYFGSIMVLGSMSYKGLDNLICIGGKGNSEEYQRVMPKGYLPTTDDIFMSQHCIFQHNLAFFHACRSTNK